MKKSDILTWGLALLAIISVLSFNACGDDPVPDAELDREKFLGEYLGSLECPTTLSLLTADSVSFSIDTGSDLNDKQSIVIFLPIEGQPAPLSVNATVTGNNVSFVDKKEGVPLAQLGNTLVDIDISGNGSLQGDIITGEMNIDIVFSSNGDPIGMDVCTITGTKQ